MNLSMIEPTSLIPPHRITHEDRLIDLQASLRARGWLGLPLIGYRLADGSGGLQLLSGTHRRMAAVNLGLRSVPVVVYPEWVVRAVWGSDRWSLLMNGAL